MIEIFAAEKDIDRPVGEVWARLTDWGGAPRWMPGVEAMRAEGPTTLVFTARGRERTSRISVFEPEERFTLTSVQGGVTADYAYTCTPRGEGTRVGLVATCRMTGPIRLLRPVITAAIRKADSGQLDAFAATFRPG